MNLVSVTIPLLIAGAVVAAPTNPFTETFDAGASNWLGGDFLPPTEFASGGIGDSGYIQSSTGFEFNDPESLNVVFRGNKSFFPGADASGGAFIGDWISAGITNFSFSVRHNISVPTTFFVRFAADTFGAPFPGGVAVAFQPVFAGQWTTISIDINPANPAFVSFEGSTYESVFSNIGFIQIGVLAPDALLGDPRIFQVDLDHVAIVPAPAGLLALAPVLVAGSRRRR